MRGLFLYAEFVEAIAVVKTNAEFNAEILKEICLRLEPKCNDLISELRKSILECGKFRAEMYVYHMTDFEAGIMQVMMDECYGYKMTYGSSDKENRRYMNIVWEPDTNAMDEIIAEFKAKRS